MKIGIIGEFNPGYYTQVALNEAFVHSAKFLNKKFSLEWIPTDMLSQSFEREVKELDGILMSMGTPYRDMDAALKIIKYARENDVPLLAICGGFQHVQIEHARNVKGIEDAEHEETSPGAKNLLISALSCSLVGETENLRVINKDSKVYEILGTENLEGKYHCNYGLNKKYESILFDGNLLATVVNEKGEIRGIELREHKFFIGTLFQHQLDSEEGSPSKLLNEFILSSFKK
ncbi:MAG: CTP synthase [Bacteroidetes bacterium]|nr:CTP synthase [Bacteroidota bacterium]